MFKWLAQEGGIAPHELARTFNCGIGMVAVVSPDQAANAIRVLTEHGETVFTIGTIRARVGDEAQSQVTGLI